MKASELKKMTVKNLRELASEKTDAAGLTAMKKDELIALLADEKDEDSKAAKKVSAKKTGKITTKEDAKKEVLRLKQKKEGLASGDNVNYKQLKNVRRRIRNLKRLIRSA